ncbi:MAG TPA: GNAT family N-acetyltransferase [Vicinamibacterales bacterium]|nr:GNAT family N-acetyltransferase [Vicinamibacterales bacterium]
MIVRAPRDMTNVSIRPEEPHDAADVRETNEQAFGTQLEARLVDALRGSPGSISLVATVDGRVVGHILFTPVTIDPPLSRRVAGLAPMAVRPTYQRQGVGSRLVRAGLHECRRHGYAAVVLVGHPEYYPRFGFVPGHTHGLQCEFPAPPEAFMVLELDAGALRGAAGVVRYRREFAEAAPPETPAVPQPEKGSVARIALPRTKVDTERADALSRVAPEQLSPHVAELLVWLQDMNWPVARSVAAALSRGGDELVEPVRTVLRSDDDIWKAWVLSGLLPHVERRVRTALRDDILRIANQPTPGELENEADVAARALLSELDSQRETAL